MRYRFNEHGICTNPDELVVINSGKFYANIETACYKRKWSYGISVQYKKFVTGTFAHSYGVSNKGEFPGKFNSRREAIISAAKEIIKHIADRTTGIKNYSYAWEVKIIKKFIFDNFQEKI